jgi:tripartite-type tricarboxylate transporter receptor subunit TctC
MTSISTSRPSIAMLEEKTGARYTHVPYKGAGAAYQQHSPERLGAGLCSNTGRIPKKGSPS